MRKIFTLLTMCLMATALWAQKQVIFIPSETVGVQESVSTSDEMTNDCVTISSTYAAFAAPQYRFGKNAVTTFTSTDGNIIKIEFFCQSTNPANGFGEQDGLTFPGNNGEWEGTPASSVVLTTQTKQVRATKIIVTVDDGSLSAPTFDPAPGTFYAPVKVSISCMASDAKIYYTTNGTDPTTSSTLYSAPIEISTKTTIKAISVRGSETSDVVTGVYEFSTATPVYSIEEYQELPDGTECVFMNPVNVLWQCSPRMFVQDATGTALFYGDCGQTYKNGDVIPAGFVGQKTTWDGEPELQHPEGFQPASANSKIDATPITASEVGPDKFAQFVVLKGVTIDKTNKKVTDATGTASYFCNMDVKDADITDGMTCDMKAIVGSYGKAPNTVYQLLPVSLDDGGVEPTKIGLGDLGNLPDKQKVTMGYDITVFAQTGRYLYAMDETGFGLIYGDTGHEYTFGDVVPSGFSGTKVTWDGEPELQYPSGMQEYKDNVALTPSPLTPSQVSHDTWGQYAMIEAVINTGSQTLEANGESCPYFNDRFNVELPTDGKTHKVYGIVGSHGKAPNTVYQFLPLSIDVPPIPDHSLPTVANLQELYNNVPKQKQAQFTEPLTAVFQYNEGKIHDLYIVDANGEFGLVFGEVDGTFNNGDYINDAVASWTTFTANNILELTPKAETFVPTGHGTAIEPLETEYFDEISTDMIHQYFRFVDVTIEKRIEVVNDTEQTNYYMIDENGDELMIYDRYNKGLATADLTKTFDVEGFLTIFSKNKIKEIYISMLKVHGDWVKGDVNGDGEVNIADVNALIDIILGADADADTKARADVNEDSEINVADVNALIDIILG